MSDEAPAHSPVEKMVLDAVEPENACGQHAETEILMNGIIDNLESELEAANATIHALRINNARLEREATQHVVPKSVYIQLRDDRQSMQETMSRRIMEQEAIIVQLEGTVTHLQRKISSLKSSHSRDILKTEVMVTTKVCDEYEDKVREQEEEIESLKKVVSDERARNLRQNGVLFGLTAERSSWELKSKEQGREIDYLRRRLEEYTLNEADT